MDLNSQSLATIQKITVLISNINEHAPAMWSRPNPDIRERDGFEQ
ncbi:MAG: hypothetical protein ABUJ92_12780 [Desulfobacterales bacterium]